VTSKPTATISPTQPGGAIATPSPLQPGTVDNCSAFYLTKKGDSCIAVADAQGISLSDFLAWNPCVGGQRCDNLWADAYVCVNVIGRKPNNPRPTPSRPENGVSTPEPFQRGMTDECKVFYMVEKGENCRSISRRFGVSLEEFLEWNPAAGRSCANLWAGTYCCVGVF